MNTTAASTSASFALPPLERWNQWRKHDPEIKEHFDHWAKADAVVNTVGGGLNLDIGGNQVMQEWETPLMKRISEIATEKGGRILEVGFGLGISARYVQSFPIEEHVIIEANATVFQQLQEFAKMEAKHKVTPLFGFWQEVSPTLPSESFDGILFDPFPIAAEDLVGDFKFLFIHEAHRLLKKGGILTYYSHEKDNFAPDHEKLIKEMNWASYGFENIPVEPPAECVYWQHHSMIAPKLIK